MLRLMDWQQLTALGVVAITAALFARNCFRPSRSSRFPFSIAGGKKCGCFAGIGTPPPTVIYRARKGESLRVEVRAGRRRSDA